MFKWNALICGPKNSPYYGYMFKFETDFPEDYPGSPPEVTCKTPIYHMNIDLDGDVCVSSIKEEDKWENVKDISSVLLSIFIIIKRPNPDNPYREDIANLYLNNMEEYEKQVKNHCEENAIKIPE